MKIVYGVGMSGSETLIFCKSEGESSQYKYWNFIAALRDVELSVNFLGIF